MKSTGIVRKVDELGRIVLPIELRRTLDIAEKDSLEIYVDGASIVRKRCDQLQGQKRMSQLHSRADGKVTPLLRLQKTGAVDTAPVFCGFTLCTGE